MTGDHNRQRVCRTGSGDGAYRTGLTNRLRHLLVTCRFTAGNCAKGLPDALLERGTANIQRQRKRYVAVINTGNDLVDPLYEGVVPRRVRRFWKLRGKLCG
jgi:hypothetical protein